MVFALRSCRQQKAQQRLRQPGSSNVQQNIPWRVFPCDTGVAAGLANATLPV